MKPSFREPETAFGAGCAAVLYFVHLLVMERDHAAAHREAAAT
jgi:hypothetical protein